MPAVEVFRLAVEAIRLQTYSEVDTKQKNETKPHKTTTIISKAYSVRGCVGGDPFGRSRGGGRSSSRRRQRWASIIYCLQMNNEHRNEQVTMVDETPAAQRRPSTITWEEQT